MKCGEIMRIVTALAAVLAALLIMPPVFGASQQDRDDCYQATDPDLKIRACTAVIEDRSENQRNRVIAYNSRGIAWRRKGNYDRAIADYTEAIRLDPKYVLAYNNRCFAWYLKKDYDRAIADCNEAIRLDPKHAQAYNNRGIVWHEKGDLDRAFADFNEAIRLDPKIAEPHNNRGIIWRKKQQYD